MPRGEDQFDFGSNSFVDETTRHPQGDPQADVPTTAAPAEATSYLGGGRTMPARHMQAPADPNAHRWQSANPCAPVAQPASPVAPTPGDTMVAGGQVRTQLRPQAYAASPYPYPQSAGQPYAQQAASPYPQAPYQAAGRAPGQDPRYVRPAPSPAPVEAPRREAFDPYDREGRGRSAAAGVGGTALSLVLRLVAFACRIFAIVLAFLVVANAVAVGPFRMYLFDLTARVTGWIPATLSGAFVYETPLGGNLRGDFVIVSVVLFIIDWLLVRKARDLRR